MSEHNQPEYVLLEEWAEKTIRPKPSLWTLREMAKGGKISPPPVKIGKAYYVELGARVINPADRATLVQRLRRA